jgi:hypothetical protein
MTMEANTAIEVEEVASPISLVHDDLGKRKTMEKTNTAIEVQEVATVISSKPDDVGVLSKETKGNELEENWMTID